MHADVNYNVTMLMPAQALRVSADATYDVAGNTSHGKTKTMMESLAKNLETYTVRGEDNEYTQYMLSDDSGSNTWTKVVTDTGDMLSQLVDKELFKDAKFQKTGGGYKITVPGKGFAKALASMGFSNYLTMMGYEETFDEEVKKSEAEYRFDKDCLLTGMDFAINMESSSTSEGGAAMKTGMTFDLRMSCSDYGEVDAAKVAVPEEVKKSAVGG